MKRALKLTIKTMIEVAVMVPYRMAFGPEQDLKSLRKIFEQFRGWEKDHKGWK